MTRFNMSCAFQYYFGGLLTLVVIVFGVQQWLNYTYRIDMKTRVFNEEASFSTQYGPHSLHRCLRRSETTVMNVATKNLSRMTMSMPMLQSSVGYYDRYEYWFNPSDLCIYFSWSASARYIRKKCAMIINDYGRLGNLMGHYASLLGLAYLNDRPAFITRKMSKVLRKYFQISLPAISKQLLYQIEWTNHSIHDWMDESYEHFSGQYVFLQGFPCSWTFYHHIRNEILKEFTFHDHISKRAQDRLRAIQNEKKRNLTFVGVHVRRGDYWYLMKYLYRGVLADADFLTKATNYFRVKYSNSVFLVTSDDIDWCVLNMDNSKNDVYFIGNNDQNRPIEDFSILANCNHSIITIGTFGYWAAYLAGGETIYLSNYTMPDSKFLKVLRYDAFYLPNWIPIAANLSKWNKM